jgi:hypothetical protein
MIGAKGLRMATRPRVLPEADYPIDRDPLQLPESVIDNIEQRPDKILKPCFDALWNAVGRDKDDYYNDNGEWIKP